MSQLVAFLTIVLVLGAIMFGVSKITESEHARRAMLEAGPTVVTPVSTLAITNGKLNILVVTPDQQIRGINYDYAYPASSGLEGRVVRIEGPSEIEWYGADSVWTNSRVKQIRLNKAKLQALGVTL